MTYLEEFKTQINNRNFSKFLQLWEEYSSSDTVDVEEFSNILIAIKKSDFSSQFGKMIETAIPLWQLIQDKNDSYQILKLLIDIQVTHSPILGDLANKALQDKYGDQPQFNERLRLIGMRPRDKFQGALSNYDLLNHLQKGKFLFHSGGWGAGEIIDVSSVRQQITIEFENVSGKKYVTFENAFNALTPLDDQHFLARRFADPDKFEKEAKEDPVAIIKLLLQDLGPHTASEIKDQLCELVIPENEWSKWWQNTRAKLKKDPVIESPENLKDTFRLRRTAITNEERLQKTINQKTDIDDIILSSYHLIRDLSSSAEHHDIRESVKNKLHESLKDPLITPAQQLQIAILLDTYFTGQVDKQTLKDQVKQLDNVGQTVESIEIISLKKRALILIKEERSDWPRVYLQLLYSISHNLIREFIFKELSQNENREMLKLELDKLIANPELQPDFFVWFFQSCINKDKGQLFFDNKEGQCILFDTLLILLSKIENRPEYRDLTKKIYTILTAKRYVVVRNIMEGAQLDHVKEFLLLAAKCHTLNDQDRKILRSLAAVVHPTLTEEKSSHDKRHDNHILWTTEESYLRVQTQVKHLGSVEIVENAKEIEAARALGDLRENSEFKFAKEKRARLLGQLKSLSEQLQKARIITPQDVSIQEVGIGNVVELADSQGKALTYTILGPWEADAEQNILSFQSKLAQLMLGLKKGETFIFKDEEYKVNNITSIFK